MLNNIEFKYIYSTGEEASPISFFTQALLNSKTLDLGLGFFSSASINVLSVGFAMFIANGGTMRLYINQHITDEDYEVLTATSPQAIEQETIDDFNAMLQILSKRDKHFFNCLSYLISANRIKIKIIIPKTGGIAHQKFGIFTDAAGNKVAFNGSLNFTASALLSKNLETITCYISWEGHSKIINECEAIFDKFFSGQSKDIIVYDASNLEKSIIKSFPTKEVKDLLEEEKQLVAELNKSKSVLYEDLNGANEKPYFPYPTGARQYQKDAYSSWTKSECRGIFAMATGTGKTITSLNCVLEEYLKNGIYRVLILVPSIDLVNQWVEEFGKFNFRNIYIVNGTTNWRKELTSLKNNRLWGVDCNYIIISTYASFTNPTFQDLLSSLNDDNMILIADEAHNVGSPNVLEAFKDLAIRKRIALSATPNRAYDIEGTTAIENLFNDKPPYCYSFSMERAIKEGMLMEYLYFPKLVYLDTSEMENYQRLTKLLLRYFNTCTKKFDSNPEVERLLMQRKRIIHKAQDKYRVFNNILNELVDKKLTKYCFVYAPEGLDYTTDDNERFLSVLQKQVNDAHPSITTNSFVGGDGDKKDKLRGFAEGKIDMLFAMKCLDEGVDVPRAEVGVFTSSTGNPRQFIQRRGRLLRKHPDKTFATIYDMIVVPNFNSHTDGGSFEMERSLVKSELMRVAYFASLASNYNHAINGLSEMLAYYGFEVSALIEELKGQ